MCPTEFTQTFRDFIPFDYDNYNSFICVCQWFRDKFRFPYNLYEKIGRLALDKFKTIVYNNKAVFNTVQRCRQDLSGRFPPSKALAVFVCAVLSVSARHFFMTKFSRFSNTDIDALISGFLRGDGVSVFTDGNFAVFPGFCDVHVHLREPGFSYKETIKTGTLAAAHGGYTDVCAMPNLSPVPDSVKSLEPELDAIKRDAVVRVHPYGSITKGELGNELSDMAELAPYVCALSDDGKGVASGDIMQSAMLTAKSAGKIIAAHCEDMSFVNGGYIRDCVYARANGHRTIQPESEYMQVERDLKLAEKTGVAYHICHISTKESVDLVRQAKKRGIDITCEIAPHYLVLTTDDLRDDGCFRMNPPLGTNDDRKALIDGIRDGTIDMIATDHAPHSAEEKSGGLAGSAFGIVGLETAFPVLYTELVMAGIIGLDRLCELMCVNPRKRFGIPFHKDDYTVFDLGSRYTIQSKEFISMGRSTPFEGRSVCGKCIKTVCGGKTVWQENMTEN